MLGSLVVVLALGASSDAGTVDAGVSWTALAPGVEFASFALDPGASSKQAVAQVVRVDPAQATLRLGLASRDTGGAPKTAGAWADQLGGLAVINAGMFASDHSSNVGRLVDGAHVNHDAWNDYQSVLVMGPKKPGLPKAQLIDLDAPGARALTEQYQTVVQNLRLIKSPGVSLWKPNKRAWSESAIAQDAKGRLLLVYVHDGLQMSDFNRLLLASGLEVVRAMHVEGGPEASLSLRGAVKADHFGSYETGFFERDTNAAQWELPNVLVVMPAAAAPKSK